MEATAAATDRAGTERVTEWLEVRRRGRLDNLMLNFTPLHALLGGALIGLGASGLMLFTRRLAGMSGIVGGLLRPSPGESGWRLAFIAGLLGGGLGLAVLIPGAIGAPVRSHVGLAFAGLLVGFGARLGRGCTSGHGVCGISRLSPSSLLATVTFMFTGMVTVALVRSSGWFSP